MNEIKEKKRADRNRTLTVSVQERDQYSQKLLRIKGECNLDLDAVINKTIVGDLYSSLDSLPKGFADLIVIDPPYNLDKDFHGFKFKSYEFVFGIS